MRWQLSLQLAVGLAALFGVGHNAIEAYVEPPATAMLQRTAAAEAGVAAGDAAVEWQRMKSVQQRLVRAAAESPILSTLGGQFQSGEPRHRALKAALESLVAQAGTDGQAVLVTTQGAVIASAGELTAQLAKGAAMKDALLGGTAVRFELVEGTGRLVAAAPITSGSGSNTLAVLVLASPIDNQRLTVWSGHLPVGAAVVLALGKEIFATTLAGKKAADFAAPELGASVEIDGEAYATSAREIVDDAGVVIRAIGVARHDQTLQAGIKTRVQFLVIAFGALSILICVAVVMMSPFRTRGESRREDEQEQRITRKPGATSEPDTFFDDSMLPPPTTRPSVQLPLPPQRGLMAPQSPVSTSQPSVVQSGSSPTMPPRPAAAAAAAKPEVILPPTKSPAGMPATLSKSDTAKLPRKSPQQPAEPAAIEAIPLPANRPMGPPVQAQTANPEFDAIAAAAMSSAPPPVARQQQQPQPSIDPHPDLPMPIEHLQLPTTRESVQPTFSQRSRSTQMQRGWQGNGGAGPGAGGGGEDPWRNATFPPPSSSGMRQQQAPNSDDLPHVRHDAAPQGGKPSMSAPPMASTRPYQPSQSTSQPIVSANREPVAFDEEHYRVVYNEFVGSKARLGEAVDNITFEGFSSKLRSSEKELIDRHGCKAVRFQVLVKDRQVSLRPQLVR